MYIFIIPNINQLVQDTKDIQPLPETYGPYPTSNEAVGAAIDWFRCSCAKEPSFTLQSFGENAENIKLLVSFDDKLELGATINKLY